VAGVVPGVICEGVRAGVDGGGVGAGVVPGVICEGVRAGAGAGGGVAGCGTGAIVWAMPGVIQRHTCMTASEPPRINRFVIKRILDLIHGFIIY
jgi:hypothetical protein